MSNEKTIAWVDTENIDSYHHRSNLSLKKGTKSVRVFPYADMALRYLSTNNCDLLVLNPFSLDAGDDYSALDDEDSLYAIGEDFIKQIRNSGVPIVVINNGSDFQRSFKDFSELEQRMLSLGANEVVNLAEVDPSDLYDNVLQKYLE